LPKPSLGAEPSLKTPSMEAFGPDPCAVATMPVPVLSDHWTLMPVCCTGLVARKFRLAKPEPLSVASPPPARFDAHWRLWMVLLRRRSVHLLSTPSRFLPPPSAIRLDLNGVLCSLSSSDD
jgi:hypothetical protein